MCDYGRYGLTVTDDAPDPTPPEPQRRRRIGRPAERKIPRTHLNAWMARTKVSSPEFMARCAAEAEQQDIPAHFVPSRASIDDMRVGRMYPSLVVARLIEIVTQDEIGLKQWADDIQRFGTRHGKRIA